MKEILKLDHIQKFYGNEGNVTKAIQDIDFSVQEGEFLGIMGVFFASTFWRKMQNIFGECCISKLEKVARPRLAAILPAT